MKDWTYEQLTEYRNSKRNLLQSLPGYSGNYIRRSPLAIVLQFDPVTPEIEAVIRREFAGVPVEIVLGGRARSVSD